MKYCSNCGCAMDDNASYCNSCGTSANTVDANRAHEQRCLDKLATGLKHEKLCYKIFGIVSLVLAGVFLLISVITLIGGGILTNTMSDSYFDEYGNYYYYDNYDYYDDYYDDYYEDYYNGDIYFEDSAEVAAGVAFAAVGSVYIFLGLMFLAIGIVNLVLSSKVGKYRKNIYTDCTAAANHASSVGSIVLAAFFNEIALIFVIINFVFMKKNAATFEAIKANQKSN